MSLKSRNYSQPARHQPRVSLAEIFGRQKTSEESVQGSWWIISSKELKFLPLVCAARWDISSGSNLRGTPGRTNEDSDIG
jgi:hypothetical protein